MGNFCEMSHFQNKRHISFLLQIYRDANPVFRDVLFMTVPLLYNFTKQSPTRVKAKQFELFNLIWFQICIYCQLL